MSDLDFLAFDADNHYYEALDAFTRHLDPKLGSRIVQWAQIDGRMYHVIGGQVSHAVVNPTFNPVAKAGRPVRVLPRQPVGTGPDGVPARARADPARVPRPRRPAGDHGRARPRAGLALPDPRHDLRAAAQVGPRGGRHHVPGLQPLAGGGLGLPVPESDLRRPLHRPGRHRRRRRRARAGPRPRRPGRRHAPGRPHDPFGAEDAG